MTTVRPIPILSVSVAEAAKSLGVSRDHIYDLIADGEFDVTKSGSRTLILWRSLEDYLERNRRAS